MATTLRWNYAGLAGLRNHIQKIHDSVVQDVESDARRLAAKLTGEMASTIHSRVVQPLLFILTGNRLSWTEAESRVVVGSDHWHLVEYPTQPHVIRPRRPAYALFWPGALHPVYIVHHPGTEAQPFMRPALYRIRTLKGRP
jgi:hypothetical protein